MAMGTLHKKLMYYYYLKINISTGKKIIWGKTNVTFIQNYSKSYFLKSKNNPYNWIPSLKTYKRFLPFYTWINYTNQYVFILIFNSEKY